VRCKGVRLRLARDGDAVRELRQEFRPLLSVSAWRLWSLVSSYGLDQYARISMIAVGETEGQNKTMQQITRRENSQRCRCRKKRSVACIFSFVYSSVEASRQPKDALLHANAAHQWVGRGICGMAIPNDSLLCQIGSLMLTDGRAANECSRPPPRCRAPSLCLGSRPKVGSEQAQWPYCGSRQHP
jgi:hypothetical protein